MAVIDVALAVAASGVGIILLLPRLRDSASWRATVTPLASIIGSGFLVTAPLLGHVLGRHAWIAMLGIVAAAYVIGAVIRFNIAHAEPILQRADPPRDIQSLERLSNLVLSAAYVISIAFYIHLLASFVLSGFEFASDANENLLASGLLALIGIVGWCRGLHGLELLETVSVSVKLSIIAAMLFGFLLHDVSASATAGRAGQIQETYLETARILAGMLLVVQGFETSRYLAAEYSAEMRVRTMRRAQLISAGIYVCFIVLAGPMLDSLSSDGPDETAIISLASQVAVSLPLLLVIAAIMSQFSAAIADTLGAGGLVAEETRGKVGTRAAYPVIALLAIHLIWISNIFEIIAFASRAFAFYYFTQAVVAFLVARTWTTGRQRLWRCLGFATVAVALLLVTIFALPVT